MGFDGVEMAMISLARNSNHTYDSERNMRWRLLHNSILVEVAQS